MNHENRTREKLAGGEPAFGIFQSIGSVAVSEILANREFDWVLVDMEHGQMGIETAGDLFAAIERGGPTPLVRVPGNDQATIKRALDAGAMGVMVPLVNSGEEAARAVRYCRYAPGGIRGLGPGRASLFGIRLMEYAATADSRVMVIVQAEHIDAVEHIDEIVKVPGIDVVFVGPFDLACSMGHIGRPDHPEVEAAIARVLAATLEAGLIPGIFCMGAEAAVKRAGQGFRFVAAGLDSLSLNAGLTRTLDILATAPRSF